MGNEEFKMNLLVESTDSQLPRQVGGVEGLAALPFGGNGKCSEVIYVLVGF